MSQFSKNLAFFQFLFLFLYRSEVDKIKLKWSTDRHHYSFNLYWVDKDGMVFPIKDDQELEAATKEMKETSCPLTIIAEIK